MEKDNKKISYKEILIKSFAYIITLFLYNIIVFFLIYFFALSQGIAINKWLLLFIIIISFLLINGFIF